MIHFHVGHKIHQFCLPNLNNLNFQSISFTSVAVNKMDQEGSDEAFEEFLKLYKSKLSKLVKVHSIVPVSCYTGQGLDELRDVLFEMKYKKKNKIKEIDLV